MKDRLFTFREVIAIIKDGEEYLLQSEAYRLKKISCKGNIIEFESSQDPIRVGEHELYKRTR